MLMANKDNLGLKIDALCVAVVNNKQFQMTAMDIAGMFEFLHKY